MNNSACVVFDLDDTLYKEIDFLKSAYKNISNLISDNPIESDYFYELLIQSYNEGKNPFKELCRVYKKKLDINELVSLYRSHIPDISLTNDAINTLNSLKKDNVLLGIITDGREVTQINKIKSLKLYNYFDKENIIISESFGSEKPNKRNYLYFCNRHPEIKNFFYVGDNPSKDFLAPNELGWITIGLLDDGKNIHSQECQTIEKNYMPKIWISNLIKIKDFFQHEL